MFGARPSSFVRAVAVLTFAWVGGRANAFELDSASRCDRAGPFACMEALWAEGGEWRGAMRWVDVGGPEYDARTGEATASSADAMGLLEALRPAETP